MGGREEEGTFMFTQYIYFRTNIYVSSFRIQEHFYFVTAEKIILICSHVLYCGAYQYPLIIFRCRKWRSSKWVSWILFHLFFKWKMHTWFSLNFLIQILRSPQCLGFPLYLQDGSLAIFALLSPQFCSILPPKPGFSPRLTRSLCLMSIMRTLVISTNPGYLLSAENTVYG